MKVLLYIVAISIFILDQLIKWLIRANLANGQAVPLIPGVLELLHIQNPGGAFSILENQTWLFILVAILVIVAVIVIDRRYSKSTLTAIGLGLLLGGAIGNMTDRMISHTVTDYMYISIIHFPIFNLADASIDVGVALLLISSFRGDAQKSKEKEEKQS